MAQYYNLATLGNVNAWYFLSALLGIILMFLISLRVVGFNSCFVIHTDPRQFWRVRIIGRQIQEGADRRHQSKKEQEGKSRLLDTHRAALLGVLWQINRVLIWESITYLLGGWVQEDNITILKYVLLIVRFPDFVKNNCNTFLFFVVLIEGCSL